MGARAESTGGEGGGGPRFAQGFERRWCRDAVRIAVMAVWGLDGSGGAIGSEPLVPRAEIVGLESADARTLVLLVRDDASRGAPSQQAADYRVDGRPPARVGRFSATLYEERAEGRNDTFPQVVLHRLYLVLDRPLEEGHRYDVASPAGAATLEFHSDSTVCESLKFNQNGYNARVARRDAFHAPWLGDLGASTTTPPARFQVVRADGGAVVLEGVPTACGGEEDAGARAYRLDLTPLTDPGTYRLVVPGVGCSEAFGVGDVWAHHAFYVHLKGLYHQRCGTAIEAPFSRWTRAACHTSLGVTDAEPPGFIPEATPVEGTLQGGGGHHDAGDFDVRLVHTLVAGWLLSAYELYPSKFVDGQLDIPESGNGIPDLLDEALYSLRAWENLQAEDGGIRAGFETYRHPAYGQVDAATDDLPYRTYRTYGHTTLAGGALMAYAARLVRPFDAARAEGLLARARRAWAFYERHREDPEYRWSPGARLFAGCQLYLATGEASFHDAMADAAATVFGLDGRKATWPAQHLGHLANLNYVDGGMVLSHYFAGYLLETKVDRRPELVKALRDSILRQAEEVKKALERPGFAYVRLGDWGLSTAQGRYADYLFHAHRLTGDRTYVDLAARLADFTLGANPAGRSFTTGLGHRPPFNPCSLDSYTAIARGLGPVPGLVVYGLTTTTGGAPYEMAVRTQMHPAFDQTPPGRRYTDGWSLIMQNEYTVWETLAPNAFLHACLAPDPPLRGEQLPYGQSRPPGGYPEPRGDSP